MASLQLEARKSDASPEDKALREGMAERFADMGEKAGVFAGMRRVSPAMHGHALLNEISVQAQAMFSALDALERNTGMSPAAFTAAADGLKRQVEALKSRMDAPGVNSGMIQEDAGLREALSGLLRRASERLEGLHQIEARREVSAAVSDLLPEIDPEQLDVLAGVMPFSNLSALVQGLKPSVALYNDELRTLKQQVEAGQITDAQFKAGMISAAGHLRTGSARESIEVLQMLSILSRSDIRTIEEFQYEYEDYSGVMLDTNTARIFMTFLKSDTFMKGEVAALMDKLVTSPMAHADVLDAQMDDIVAMKNMFDSGRMVLRGEYVSAALERHVDMPTVLEASLRGIPADQLEMRASDALRTGARVLGQGVGSTVQLCTYRGEGGEEVSLVFKPEVGARQSLAQLCAGQLGFGTELRVMQLNVAACRSADAIGCGDVVARSSIGMNEGRLGLFMEVAPGRSAADISDGKPCAVTSDGREISFAEALGRLDSKGLRGHMLGNLMRELSRLEWADLLSGQSDRHMGNYLVYINADTGDVKVTGIDNDASFSRRRVGATTVDITGEPGLHGALQASGVTFPRMLVDVQKLSAGQREALVNGMGALLFSGAGTAWNVDKVPGQREALQRAGLSLPPMTVEVGSLTDDKRSALEGILGRSVQRNEVVPVSRDMLERLSDADITVSSVLINPQLLDPEYQSVLINTFGEHWLGAMADPMDVGTIPAAQQILRNTGMDLPRMVIDTRSFTDKQYRVLEPKYGFKQLALLPRIDRQTFQALMAVDENDYRQRLAPCMDREALDAAVLRLRDAKRRAEELEKRQCVVDDWEAPGFLSALVRERKGNPEGLSSVMQNCLFLRDFWECAGLAARV